MVTPEPPLKTFQLQRPGGVSWNAVTPCGAQVCTSPSRPSAVRRDTPAPPPKCTLIHPVSCGKSWDDTYGRPHARPEIYQKQKSLLALIIHSFILAPKMPHCICSSSGLRWKGRKRDRPHPLLSGVWQQGHRQNGSFLDIG